MLTWSARGFGSVQRPDRAERPRAARSRTSPRLIDWLAHAARGPARRERRPARRRHRRLVRRRGLAARRRARRPRSTPSPPSITYWNLADALFPDGVFKKLWAGIFFNSGGGCRATFETRRCARCTSGSPSPASRTPPPASCSTERCPVRRRRPHQGAHPDRPGPDRLALPARPGRRHGRGDHARTARPSPSTGSPAATTAATWRADRVDARVGAWFDRYLKGDKGADTGPAFRVTRTGGIDSTDGAALLRGASGDALPGLAGTGAAHRSALTGARAGASPTRPARARPPSPPCPASAAGGLPALLPRRRRSPWTSPASTPRFDSAPLGQRPARHRVAHRHRARQAPTGATPCCSPRSTTSAPDGQQQVLPAQLVAPVRVDRRAQHGKDRRADAARRRPRGRRRAPAAPGPRHHRPRLRLPGRRPATYTVSLDGPR